MDETAEKGLGSGAANRQICDVGRIVTGLPGEHVERELKICDVGRIVVKGYDTGLPGEHVERELKKLYSSCGEITDVYIPMGRNSLWSSAIIYFVGEGAVDKAMQLNGIDMGGWTVCAEAFPFLEEEHNYAEVEVKGYDTSLSKSDIDYELMKLFSSCGKIGDLRVFKSSSVLFLRGEDSGEKASKLNGSDMRGHKLVVRLVSHHGITTVHPRPHHPLKSYCRPNKKAKMSVTKKKKKSKMTWLKALS